MLTFIEGNVVITAAGSPPPVSLGRAAGFAAVASSTLTNTGSSVLTGDLGLSPGTSVTGFPPGTVTGTQHITDTAAANAQTDIGAAFVTLNALPGATVLTGDLGGMVLAPGVYKYATSAQLTGILTLDGRGNPNASWVFQIGTTLTTAHASSVVMINSGSAANVFWQVGTSATLGTASAILGQIIANASITLTTGASLSGGAFALTGAVTLDTNAVISLPLVSSTPGLGTLKGSGIKSVVRVSVGVYDIFLEDSWMRYLGGSAGFVAAPSATAGIAAIEVEGDPNPTVSQLVNPKLRLHMLNFSGALADPNANSVFGFKMYMRNSSIKGTGE